MHNSCIINRQYLWFSQSLKPDLPLLLLLYLLLDAIFFRHHFVLTCVEPSNHLVRFRRTSFYSECYDSKVRVIIKQTILNFTILKLNDFMVSFYKTPRFCFIQNLSDVVGNTTILEDQILYILLSAQLIFRHF